MGFVNVIVHGKAACVDCEVSIWTVVTRALARKRTATKATTTTDWIWPTMSLIDNRYYLVAKCLKTPTCQVKSAEFDIVSNPATPTVVEVSLPCCGTAPK